jgi:hypothetical protein
MSAAEMHLRELDQIGDKLAAIVPDNFFDALDLLRFAIREAKDGLSNDDMELNILENVTEALFNIRRPKLIRLARTSS